MSYWQEGLLVLGMLVVTLGIRYPMLALAGRVRMHAFIVRALAYVPVAVLSAIAVPIMLAPEGQLAVSVSNEYLVAGIFAIVFVAITRHLLLTITLGMALFLMLRFMF